MDQKRIREELNLRNNLNEYKEQIKILDGEISSLRNEKSSQEEAIAHMK